MDQEALQIRTRQQSALRKAWSKINQRCFQSAELTSVKDFTVNKNKLMENNNNNNNTKKKEAEEKTWPTGKLFTVFFKEN